MSEVKTYDNYTTAYRCTAHTLILKDEDTGVLKLFPEYHVLLKVQEIDGIVYACKHIREFDEGYMLYGKSITRTAADVQEAVRQLSDWMIYDCGYSIYEC